MGAWVRGRFWMRWSVWKRTGFSFFIEVGEQSGVIKGGRMGLLEGRRGSFLRLFPGVRFVFSIATKGEICDLAWR